MNKLTRPIILSAILVLLALAAVWKTQAPGTPKLPEPPLKDLAAQRSIKIGTYAALKRLDEIPYQDILTSQFEFLSVDGDLNWAFNSGTLRPTETTYDFTQPDKVFTFAREHNMPTQAHHLVWGEEKWLPAWLKNGNYTEEQLLGIMHDHIKNVGEHYKDQVREWTVVNEAFTRGKSRPDLRDWWGDKLGPAYIDLAFIWARQTDPQAKLILNDFGNETINAVSDEMYNYIKEMKGRGVPIDGIGMQMHIGGDNPPSKEDVIKNMQRFGELGIDVYVTEIDVNMSTAGGTEEEKLKKQGEIYYDMARACIESKVCPSFALLGITDKESWYNELGVPNSKPLPFDEKYRIKPAFYSLRDAFGQK